MSMRGGGVRGQWRQIGGDGEWKGTNAISGVNGRIYASHSNGKLFSIDPGSGQWNQVGNASTWKTRLMFSLGGMLALIEQSGTMWAVDPNSGNFQQVGKDGEWANITAGDWTKEAIYCRSNQGTLWAYAQQGGWRQIGNSSGWKSRFVFCGRGLVTVEEDGKLWRIDSNSGQSTQLSSTQYQVDAGMGAHGHVFAHFNDGGIYDLDIDSAQWSPVGDAKTWAPQAFTTTGDTLITLEKKGTLYEIFT